MKGGCEGRLTPPFRYPSRDAFQEGLCTFFTRASRKCGFKSPSVHTPHLDRNQKKGARLA